MDEEKFHFVEDKLKNKAENKQKEAEANDEITFGTDGTMIIRDVKRARIDDDAMEEEAHEDNRAKNVRKKRKGNFDSNLVDTVHAIKESGERFKATKAGGDLTNNKEHPHAFIQLNSKALNKRFKKKA